MVKSMQKIRYFFYNFLIIECFIKLKAYERLLNFFIQVNNDYENEIREFRMLVYKVHKVYSEVGIFLNCVIR